MRQPGLSTEWGLEFRRIGQLPPYVFAVIDQLKLREEILAHSWSVRTTEDSVRAAESMPGARRLPRPGRRRSPELAALEEALQRALMTRVRITGTERTGKIEVAYSSAEDLERLAEKLGIVL